MKNDLKAELTGVVEIIDMYDFDLLHSCIGQSYSYIRGAEHTRQLCAGHRPTVEGCWSEWSRCKAVRVARVAVTPCHFDT